MKFTKILCAVLSPCLALTLLVSCFSNNEPSKSQTSSTNDTTTIVESQEQQTEKIDEVSNIFLSKSELLLGIGETYSLIATVSPGNIETVLTWSSSDTSIAEINDQGLVTAKSQGTAVIKVEAPNGVLAVCNVEVKIKTGSISGNITYKYNDFVGNKPDTGAVVFLIASNITSLPCSIAMGMTNEVKDYEGVYATEVDGSGNYILNNIPIGDYHVILISKNTNSFDFGGGAKYWGPIYNMFSDDDKLFADASAGAYKVKYATATITDGTTTFLSHDFGITFI